MAGASADEPRAGTSRVSPVPAVSATTEEGNPRASSAVARSTANVSAPRRWLDVTTCRTRGPPDAGARRAIVVAVDLCSVRLCHRHLLVAWARTRSARPSARRRGSRLDPSGTATRGHRLPVDCSLGHGVRQQSSDTPRPHVRRGRPLGPLSAPPMDGTSAVSGNVCAVPRRPGPPLAASSSVDTDRHLRSSLRVRRTDLYRSPQLRLRLRPASLPGTNLTRRGTTNVP